MHASKLRKIAATIVLIISLALIIFGIRRAHKVYDADTADFGIRTFQKIKDRQLVIDTTFGGVTRKGEKLFSTYDRSIVRAKRACPT